MDQLEAELDDILDRISSVVHNIETNLTLQQRKEYFDRFPVSRWKAVARLLSYENNYRQEVTQPKASQHHPTTPPNSGPANVSEQQNHNPSPIRSSSVPFESSRRQENGKHPRVRASSVPIRVIRLQSEGCEEQSEGREEQSEGREEQSEGREEQSEGREEKNEGCKPRELIIPLWLEKLWEAWNIEPESFFVRMGKGCERFGPGLTGAFYDLFTNNGTEASVFYRRFQLRNFYATAVALDYHTGARWCRKASQQLANEIIQQYSLTTLDEDAVKSRIEEYARIGLKYQKLVVKNGIGYLLALPPGAEENGIVSFGSEEYPEIGLAVTKWNLNELGEYISSDLAKFQSMGLKRRDLSKSGRRHRNKRKREGLNLFPQILNKTPKTPQNHYANTTEFIQQTLDQINRIDPSGADFIPHNPNQTCQIDPSVADFIPQTLNQIYQIDPAVADFIPHIPNQTCQIDPSVADFIPQTLDQTCQIDPSVADFPDIDPMVLDCFPEVFAQRPFQEET